MPSFIQWLKKVMALFWSLTVLLVFHMSSSDLNSSPCMHLPVCFILDNTGVFTISLSPTESYLQHNTNGKPFFVCMCRYHLKLKSLNRGYLHEVSPRKQKQQSHFNIILVQPLLHFQHLSWWSYFQFLKREATAFMKVTHVLFQWPHLIGWFTTVGHLLNSHHLPSPGVSRLQIW